MIDGSLLYYSLPAAFIQLDTHSHRSQWHPISRPLRYGCAIAGVHAWNTEVTQSFADVPITDAGVDTLAFLEAAQGVVGLFGEYRVLVQVRTPANTSPDLLASAAFVPVQTDLKGNIAVRLLPRTSGRTGSP